MINPNKPLVLVGRSGAKYPADLVARTVNGGFIAKDRMSSKVMAFSELGECLETGHFRLANKQPHVTKTYRNIYSDGSTGSTTHTDWDDAIERSKYGKTRVGVMITTLEDNQIACVRVQPTVPQYRDGNCPEGCNPWEGKGY